MIIDEENYLMHYGVQRRSGRYPWGSGGTPIRSGDFLSNIENLKKQGFSDKQIYESLQISSTEFRARKTIANSERKQEQINTAERLADTGMSNVAIGEEMGLNESSVRALRAPGAREKADILRTVANKLKERVAEVKYLDVGSGVENHLAITSTKLGAALAILKEEGYSVVPVNTLQLGTGKETRQKVLVEPGVTQYEAWTNRNNIQQVIRFSDDGGRSVYGLLPPVRIDPNRVAVTYGKDGGAKLDGVIYVREGVSDVSLGKARYAQVRVAIGDDHFLKGMAMYKAGLPKGVDLVFNTNKENTGNKLDAMKAIKDDPDNPFGAVVKQIGEKDASGKVTRLTSAMNIVNEEGDWQHWSRTISSQVLSKQNTVLVRTQLNKTFEDRQAELGEILSLTNPTIRKKLLKTFSDSTDSASVHLKAAALPRSIWHAILPISSMPPTQIYAPSYDDGETVVLIRYPHGGTFEIPELIVNNKHPESKRLLGSSPDAVGIHHSVAERLSGADFDGDTVLVIPNDSRKIKISRALEGLKNFEPKVMYKGYEGMPKMTPRQKGLEMGKISNLITDMTIRQASREDLAKAIRHSMVVIDAENHDLNYKQSARDNGIRKLSEQYQGKPTGGASTLISRAKARTYIDDRKERPASKGGPIDKATGERVFEPTNKKNYKTGEPRQIKVKQLEVIKDAHELSSGTPVERLYADHSNRLKAMANSARLEMVNTPRLKYDPSAKKTYAAEVKSLDVKFQLAKRNRPLERQAQTFANAVIKTKRDANPNMDDEVYKKIKFQALAEQRLRTGAVKHEIIIEPNEWNAIQAGAISDNRLSSILDKANMTVVKQLATPKQKVLMTSTKTDRAQQMLASGYTRAAVAKALGVSLSTLDVATTEG